jgi:hypothetical protein
MNFQLKYTGFGGAGGGGDGGLEGSPITSGTAGAVNTGGGGGGGIDGSTSSGAGGKGVVILSMPDASYSTTTTGSPTVDTGVSGKTVLTFTGSGSYTDIMASFAKIGLNNKVIEVLSVNNEVLREDIGIDFLTKLHGWSIWKQTSYNTMVEFIQQGGTPLRKNFAGIGYTL